MYILDERSDDVLYFLNVARRNHFKLRLPAIVLILKFLIKQLFCNSHYKIKQYQALYAPYRVHPIVHVNRRVRRRKWEKNKEVRANELQEAMSAIPTIRH